MITKIQLVDELNNIPDDFQIIFNSENGVYGKLHKSLVAIEDRVMIINIRKEE